MTSAEIVYTYELAAHNASVEKLNAEAFGPARYTRAACFIRQGGPHDLSLSHVAALGEKIIGSVRMTPIVIGPAGALLLGPIVISPDHKNTGIGSRLMNLVLETARKAGHRLVILVGDEPYYRRFGFRCVPAGSMIMPVPVNPARLLACAFEEETLRQAKGIVRHVNRARDVG